MIINITYKTTIKKIRKKINEIYPFLKIEFCTTSKGKGEGVLNHHFCNPDLRLLDIAKKPEPGWIVMHPWHTIRYIKDAFKNRFEVHAKFFRKEDDQWIEILGTEGFTLQEQNEIGQEVMEKRHEVYRMERELLI